MAVPVARVHLAMAHAALPALLPTPPKWKMMMPLLTTTPRSAILPKSPPKKPGRADSDERWDARKIKPASPASSSSGKSGASSHETPDTRKIGKTPSSKPGRADSVERWDAHKKPANAAGALSDSDQRSSMMSRATLLSAAHKNPLPTPTPPPHAKTSCIADDSDSSSTGSNDNAEMDTAQSQLRRVLYVGPAIVAAPEPSMLPMPTLFIRAA
ncbi:hypothetical protein BS78_08G027400 [Paspalum vaginatum]|nr:hypothetical protein BS78_08G027400 [Paspalum vaginatum]